MKKLCVFFGGLSPEHDVSIITGMQLAKNLSTKQNVEKIYINLENRLFLASNIVDLQKFYKKNQLKLKEVYISDGAVYSKGLLNKKLFEIDCVINCCHGGIGENGDLAGFFAVNNVKFTSCNSLSAHITMDKFLTKQLLNNIVPTVDGFKVNKQNYINAVKQIKTTLQEDLIVKPNSLGSSIGVKACNKQNFKNQVEAIFELYDDALVDLKKI